MIKTVERGVMHTESINFILEECCNCALPFFIPLRFQQRLIANPDEYFYCPNGHRQHYAGKTEAQKLKEELNRTKRENEEEMQRLSNTLLDTISAKNSLQKQLKRIHKGVCPCCNRSFQNLKRHMETKHPETLKGTK